MSLNSDKPLILRGVKGRMACEQGKLIPEKMPVSHELNRHRADLNGSLWRNVLRKATLLCLASFFVALMLAVFGSLPVYAQSEPAPKAKAPAAASASASPKIPIPDIPYTKFVLDNGLTVLVHEDHKAPIVAVNTWYHVGSKNEKPGKTGFAHLFEHLMFSGSDNFNYTYINAMERIGATNLNGTTNDDRTNYFENVPTSMLDYVLFAESDRMGHLLGVLDQKKLDLQRGVVQNEKRQGENQPYGVTRQLLTENTYPVGHPYSWTAIGSMKDLDAASMSDVQEWFKTYYGPNNVTVVLRVTSLRKSRAKKSRSITAASLRARPLPTRKPGSPNALARTATGCRIACPKLGSIAYGTFLRPIHRRRRCWIWRLALGQGKTSRLYKRLVYKDQIATSASASNGTNEIAGQFYMVLTAKPGGDLKKVEMAADEELQLFLKNGPTEAELQLAKTQIFGDYARIMERIGGFGGKSDILARCQTFTGNPDCYKDYLKASPSRHSRHGEKGRERLAERWRLHFGSAALSHHLKADCPPRSFQGARAWLCHVAQSSANAESHASQWLENRSGGAPRCAGGELLPARRSGYAADPDRALRHLQLRAAHAGRRHAHARFAAKSARSWNRSAPSSLPGPIRITPTRI